MKKLMLILGAVFLMIGTAGMVYALPVSVSGPLAGTGDGLNSRWVNTSDSPHNVDNAINALALNAGDAGYISEINQIVSAIDFSDNYNINGYIPGYQRDPMTPDNSFAVGYYGFLNIVTSDVYTFNAYTDDGFRLTIGGEMISQHFGDRAPGSTQTVVFLAAGLYDFTMVGWEQGGAFVNELSWHNSQSNSWSLIDSDNFFTTASAAPVPEPATMLLLGTGLAGLAGLKRKKK